MCRTRAENASFVIASFRALGIQVPENSRLMQMYRILVDSSSEISPNAPEFEAALEAERDMQVLGFIFDVAETQAADSGFCQLIERVLGDSVLPQDDRGNSHGRDFQFELFVAALCLNAHLDPVEREEPDVTCTVNGIKYAIAAKRLKSPRNIGKRVRKGADQIQRAGYPGIIALETSLLYNQHNSRITAPISDDRFGYLYGQALRHEISKHEEKIQDWVRAKGVLGVVFHDQQLRLEPNGQWCLEGMTMTLSTARVNQRRNREFQLFENGYLRGLPNRQRLR